MRPASLASLETEEREEPRGRWGHWEMQEKTELADQKENLEQQVQSDLQVFQVQLALQDSVDPKDQRESSVDSD